MAERCPSARLAGNGRARLPEFRVVFCLTSSIVPSADEDGMVHGVIWTISTQCEKSLDEFEGVAWNYTKQAVTVFHDGRELQAMAYIMTDKIPLGSAQK